VNGTETRERPFKTQIALARRPLVYRRVGTAAGTCNSRETRVKPFIYLSLMRPSFSLVEGSPFRIGTLTCGSKSVPTPAMIGLSSRGLVRHLTPDNLARLPLDMVHVSLEHLYVSDLPLFIDFSTLRYVTSLDGNIPPFVKAPSDLHHYLGLDGHLVWLGCRNPADQEPVVPNSENGVSVRTYRGYKMVLHRFTVSHLSTKSHRDRSGHAREFRKVCSRAATRFPLGACR
jgi:hypothetical protein